MAIELDPNLESFGEEEDGDSGKGLRAKLEEALKENRKLRSTVSDLEPYRAKDLISERGFDLVKVEDLKGVKPDEIEERAKEIQSQRVKEQEDLLRSALRRQGIDEEDLDDAVKEMLDRHDAESEEAEATRRARDVAGRDSKPVPKVNESELHSFDAITAGLAKGSKRQR